MTTKQLIEALLYLDATGTRLVFFLTPELRLHGVGEAHRNLLESDPKKAAFDCHDYILLEE